MASLIAVLQASSDVNLVKFTYAIVGTVLNFTAVTRGTAVRIMTGAAMPDGADAVIPVEQTDAGTKSVLVHGSVDAGAYVRRTGEDLMECTNFGVTSLNEVREKLTERGLKLRGD
jgi:molybdopterin biosynthesis enzyme